MKKPGTLRRLLGYIGRSRFALIGVFVFALIGNAALLLAPKLIGEAIDLILPAEESFFPALLRMLAVIGVLYLLGLLFNWFTALCANRAANRTVQTLRTDLFRKLGRLPLSYYDTHSRGDMMSRFTNDIDAIADGLNQGIVQLISGVLTVVLSLLYMLSLNPLVTLVAVFVTPLCFVVGYAITKYGSRRFREQSQVLGRLNGYAEELISGQRTVKAFGYEPQAAQKFGAINQELYSCGYRAQFASALVNPSTRFVNNIAYVLVGVFGIIGGLSAGGIASFLTYTAQFSKPFNEITAITMQLQLAMASARRVFQVMDEAEQLPDAPDAAVLTEAKGTVDFRHVSFSYVPERPLIRDFQLAVKPGMKVAIVGPTGAGKTTVVNLISRFYNLNGGELLVDGKYDIAKVTLHSLRTQMGIMLQDSFIFSGTIMDNIRYGRLDATDEEVEAAARAVRAHDFIVEMEKGYYTEVNERGSRLSQGQKQLIAFARTLLSDPKILILDEATSSIDTKTERLLQEGIQALLKGRTSFIIAHRLSTIKTCDRIMYVGDKQILESGSHEELLAKKGLYYHLYTAQAREQGVMQV